VILQQTHRAAIVFVRRAQDWLCEIVSGENTAIQLPEIGIDVPLDEIYASTGLPEEPDRSRNAHFLTRWSGSSIFPVNSTFSQSVCRGRRRSRSVMTCPVTVAPANQVPLSRHDATVELKRHTGSGCERPRGAYREWFGAWRPRSPAAVS